jgi:hypothetical protein
MNKHIRQHRQIALGIASVFLPLAAFGAELDYEFSAGAAQSDNITRQPDNEQSETVAIVGVQFSLDEQTRRLEAELVGNLAYNDYLDDTYDSDIIGSFAGRTRVSLVEDRLAWTLSDNFGQVLSDPFLPETPENRGNVNYLSTGLQAGFPVGRQLAVGLGANYSQASYESRPFDSSTVGFEADFTRQIADGNSLGLNLRSAQLKYDEDALSINDHDQFEAFVRYAVTGARTRLTVDGGYSSLDSEAIGEETGALLRLNVSRRLSSASTLQLDIGQEFSNSASAFASSQIGGNIGLNAAPGLQTAAPFTWQHADLRWNLAGNRTTLGINVGSQKRKFEDQPALDQRLTSYAVNVGRDLTPVMDLQLGLRQGRTRFEIPGTDYSELSASAALAYRFTRHLVMSLTYSFEDRDSDLPIATYQESRIWLTLAYRRGVPARAMRGNSFEGSD